MARPTQNTVDYFSHDCSHKQTMYILESRYKNDGYAFWFKLLESLGAAPNHFLDLNDEIACEFLAAKTNLTWSFCDEILTLLAKIKAICPELWSKKIVWCQNFVDRLGGVYAKRKKELPVKPSFCDGNSTKASVSVAENPQSKVKEIKEDKIREDKKIKQPTPNKSAYSSDFESFWSEYPSKVAKGAAAKSFKKALKKASMGEIMNGLRNYCNSKKVADGIICNPTTWLNQERWLDVCKEAEQVEDPYDLSEEQVAYICELEERIAREEAEKAAKEQNQKQRTSSI